MGLFDLKRLRRGRATLQAQQNFNREQRRNGFFVITDKKSRFGKWDSKKKKAKFFYDIKDAAYYSYKDVYTIWQMMGMTDRYQIRMLHKNEKGERVLV